LYVFCVIINYLQRFGSKTFGCDGGVYVVQYIHNLIILSLLVAKLQKDFDTESIFPFFFEKRLKRERI